jgi:hypothetical protein
MCKYFNITMIGSLEIPVKRSQIQPWYISSHPIVSTLAGYQAYMEAMFGKKVLNHKGTKKPSNNS